MPGRSVPARLPRWRLFVTMLALLSALPLAPQAAQAQPDCAVAKAGAGGALRWLEGCGKVDPRGSPEAVARGVLAARAASLGLRSDGSDLKLLSVNPTAAATHVRFAQIHKGVPVYLGQVLVQYGPDGAVQLINNHTLPNLDVDVAPAIGADAATAAALARAPGSGQLRAPIGRELVIYSAGKAPELAWHITLYTSAPPADWHVMVSAGSGKVLGAWNQIEHATGSGQTYDPNAVQQSGNTGLADNNDTTSAALDNARVTLSLTNLDNATNKLKGSYADMTGPGVIGCSLPYTPGLADEPSRTYNYTRDDDRFEEANVYGAINGVQSWFQSLGFTNANNRSIPVDVHCIPDDNSYFSDSDGALHFGDGGVDDAEDADIAIHEYGHSVQANQVPGWGPSSNTEQRAMGEGFGDFLAGMYYIAKGDTTFLNTYKYCIGEWDATGYNPVTGGNSGSGCLRWINGRSESNGADIGVYSGTPSEEHNNGRFWSAALTCVYEGLGADATARDNIMKLVIQHHFSLTPDASNNAFEDAVAALQLADQNLFGGVNQALIISCAQGRGLITQPKLPTPSITAPAEGASARAGTALNITWNTLGAPATATYVIEYALCSATEVFSDSFESGLNGWSTSHVGGTLNWGQVTSDAHSPTHSWSAGDEPSVNDQYLVSPAIAISGTTELAFWHRYNLETDYDGGVIEISTNGGSSWADLGPQITSNGYNRSISSGFNSPIAGRPAFSGNSGGWIETLANLSTFAGQTVQLRFREADDSSANNTGWWVDDVRVSKTLTWTQIVSTTAGASSYSWTTPGTPGTYCLRIRGQAPNYLDSNYSAVRSFQLVGNQPPTLSDIGDLTVLEGTPTAPISLTISDTETLPGDLTLSGNSSNVALVPNANIVFGGSGANRTVTLMPAPGISGSTTITITVSDGQLNSDDTFVLTVTPSSKIFLPLIRRP